MVKKNIEGKTIIEKDQVNKKHRSKSEKLMKKIKYKRAKKQLKTHNFEQRSFTKYILKVFKEHKKRIELSKLPFDFDEIEKAAKQILFHEDQESVNRIINAFKNMERNPKEISLTQFKNKSIIKDVCKLMRVLKVHQNPNNQLQFSLSYMFTKKQAKARYTTNLEEIIRECLSSFSLFVKSIFQFYMQDQKNLKKQVAINDKEEEMIVNTKDDNNLNKYKDKLDTEYELIGNEAGQNSNLINRAFHKILRDDYAVSDKLKIENINEQKEEYDVKQVLPPSEFLKITMELLNNHQ